MTNDSARSPLMNRVGQLLYVTAKGHHLGRVSSEVLPYIYQIKLGRVRNVCRNSGPSWDDWSVMMVSETNRSSCRISWRISDSTVWPPTGMTTPQAITGMPIKAHCLKFNFFMCVLPVSRGYYRIDP